MTTTTDKLAAALRRALTHAETIANDAGLGADAAAADLETARAALAAYDAAPALAIDACPRCGSHAISGGAFDVDAGTCSQKIFCSECEHEWADVYTLSGQVAL